MAWALLIIAGLLEVVWATALKHADGFSRLWPSVLVLVGASASLTLLGVALRTLPMGTAYVVWVGIGAVGVTLAGILLYQEAAQPLRLGFVTLIVAGVIGLRLLEP